MERSKLRQIFNQKRASRTKCGFNQRTPEEFIKWFDSSNFHQGCKYCTLTNEESEYLYFLQKNDIRKPDATRGGKRGKRLELDRKDPAKDYDDLNNLVWCCYWCNNAKSNFYTAEEFKEIANAIGKANRKIIADSKKLQQ